MVTIKLGTSRLSFCSGTWWLNATILGMMACVSWKKIQDNIEYNFSFY